MIDELIDAVAKIGDRHQVELRATDHPGYWIRVARGSSGSILGELVTNTYYIPAEALSAERLGAIRKTGWRPTRSAATMRPAGITHRRSWPKGTRRVDIATDLLGLVNLLDLSGETTDVLLARPLPGPPRFPHAITFWNWRQDPPWAEYLEAATRLVAAGARQIHFTQPDTGGDTYAVVVAPLRLSWSTAEYLWTASVREMPSSGGHLVTWRC